MKKIIFSLIAAALLLVPDLSSAQSASKPMWPYGCRKHTISLGFYTTEVTLCCTPTNWAIPPITCIEIENKGAGKSVFYQYVMVSEIEAKIGKQITEKSIAVSSGEDLLEDEVHYRVTKKEYPIETNELKERFIKLEFTKN